MKFWHYLKTDLLSSLKQAPTLLFVLVGIPIVFSYFLTITSGRAFDVTPKAPEIPIYIQNLDTSESGRLLDTLVDQLIANDIFIKKETKEEADYIVTVSSDLGKQLGDNAFHPIQIDFSKSNSDRGAVMTKIYLDEIVHIMQQMKTINQLVSAQQKPVVLTQQIIQQANERAASTEYQISIVDSSLAVTGNQYFSITSFGFIFMTTLTMILSAAIKPEFGGLRKRLGVLPITAVENTVYSVISSTITFTLASWFYILLWKLIDGSTFSNNILMSLLWAAYLNLFVTSLGYFLAEIVSERWLPAVRFAISLTWVGLSGVIPLQMISSASWTKIVSNNWIAEIFVKPFMSLLRGEDFMQFIPLMLFLTGMIVMTLIGKIIIMRRREA